MPTDFHVTRAVGAIRVRKKCEHCQTWIEKGQPAVRTAGKFEGSMYHHHLHVECDAAAHDYYHGPFEGAGDEMPWLWELDEVHDWAWLIKEHPIAASRLNLEPKVMEWEFRHGLIET